MFEAVRVDAGHLLPALHRFNPYAADARRRLLDALVAIDQSLSRPQEARAAADATDAALVIPDLGTHSPQLRETRELIDELDEELVSLLARRARLSQRAGRYKAQMGLAVYDPVREAQLLESRRRRARERGLDADAVEEVFQVILRFSRALQG